VTDVPIRNSLIFRCGRRFPVVSGLRVSWDHMRPPNQRILSIHLTEPSLPLEDEDQDGKFDDPDEAVNFIQTEDGTRIEVKQSKPKKGEEIKKVEGGRIYKIITRNYMAEGYDGFQDLKNRKFIIDDDNGQIMSSIVRSFLLGEFPLLRLP
jgi:5'-nucleotidase